MATIRIILKKEKTNAKGEHPVVLRLADTDNKRIHFFTGFYSTEKYFDTSKTGGRFFQGRGIKTFNVVRKEEDGSTKIYNNKEANDKLAALEERAYSIIRKYNEEHINWGFEQFRADYFNAPKRESFLSFAEEIEKRYRDKGQYSTADTVKYTLISMKRFDHSLASKALIDITPRYLDDYDRFCRNEGALPATISIRMRVLKRIFNIAIGEKAIKAEFYPFSTRKDDGKYKMPQTKLTKTNQFLPLESLKRIAKTKFDSFVLERDKHLFLFSFFCMGINWIDMAHLTNQNIQLAITTKGEEISVLRYQRAKTQGEFEILIDDNIQRELDWFTENTRLFGNYILPIIKTNVSEEKENDYIAQKRKRFNRNLKRIAKELELPESQLDITSYHARHSFAMAMLDSGQPIEKISQALGHQSVTTTRHYLAKFSTTEMADATRFNLLDD